MARPCVFGCVRCFLMAMNILFMFCGLAIVGFSVWLHFDKQSLVRLDLLQNPVEPAFALDRITYTLMGIGGGIALISFLGCCGAWSESSCFLCLYSTLLVLVILAEVVCAILIAIFHSKLENWMRDEVKFNYNYDTNGSNPITATWDRMQTKMKCCGASNLFDYENSRWFNSTKSQANLLVPMSCCNFEEVPEPDRKYYYTKCQNDVRERKKNPNFFSTLLHTTGCYSTVMTSVSAVLYYIIGSAAGILVLQVLNIILTCLLMSKIRNEEAKYPPIYYADDDEMVSLRDTVYNTQRSVER